MAPRMPDRLEDLVDRCAGLIGALRPAVVITHAYEGGHPDHDTLALAVRLACRRQLDQGERIAVALGDDLIARRGVDGPEHVVEQQGQRIQAALATLH